jgi:hypothetical protein
MTELHLANLIIHILIGLAMVILAPFIIFAPKGTQRHLRLGRWYFRLGWVLAASFLLPNGGLEFIPSVKQFLLSEPGGEAHVYFLKFTEIFAVAHIVTLIGATRSSRRLLARDSGADLAGPLLAALGAAFCFWTVLRLHGNASGHLEVIAAVYGLLILSTGISPALLFRTDVLARWKFTHAICTVTNVVTLYRNFIGGGPLEAIVYGSSLSPWAQNLVLLTVNYSTLTLAVLTQAALIVAAGKIRGEPQSQSYLRGVREA